MAVKRVRLIIQYDGTEYVGWQTQPNGVAVQAELERALLEVTGERIALHGSGRTDSGVHARAQVAHFDTGARMAADKFAVALNTHLPRDIRVLWSEETDAQFHARFSAKQKQYRYVIQLGPHALVATRRTALHVHTALDVPLMRQAAADCIGTHDFAAFMSAGVTMENTVRTIFSSEWTQAGPYLTYDVAGSGFLYNMVRILAGTMIEIGKHALPPDALKRAIASKQRGDAGATAPAHGLTLYRVRYPGFDTEERLTAAYGGALPDMF
ncbi:MAG: tRNA pseudouridine(38-40) synthase TruA [Candidatus Aphodomorpha sp.]